MTSTGTNFESGYFARQAMKSDKLRWQYDRMLGFAGVRLYSSSRVLDVGCGRHRVAPRQAKGILQPGAMSRRRRWRRRGRHCCRLNWSIAPERAAVRR
ncbi:MAG: hypothetical protein U0841_08280 [Chloroflexia bacterium]